MALSFIKSSGNIITEDFCTSLAGETKADYVKDKSFGQGMKRIDETIATSFDLLRERWEELRTQIISDKLDNTTLRRRWIIPFLEYLDFRPVYLASNIISKSGIEYHIPYRGWESDSAPYIHMVNSSQDFDLKDKSSRTHLNKSPHDALQQYLNTSNHQWAILINGRKIRILRDFYHSITKGFLEFDLEAIFENASTEHFRVLYRILHKSRFENQFQGSPEIEYDDEGNPIETEDTCLLEKFHKKSRGTGVKIGTHLRDQVVEAIEMLGNGFTESLDPDEFQNGKVKEYYSEILNIIYRLLFLMFAEQKGWLPVRNLIYSQTYSIGTLRELAERGGYNFDEERDLWEGLKITFKLASDGYTFPNGDKVNAFGGQLFSEKKLKTVFGLSLKNRYLLDAIYRLSFFKVDKVVNRINYANLAIDELGSVYESLLDFEPGIASSDFKLDSREIKRGEFYLDSRGTERKTTGSYYTDSRLVAQLIDNALVPVIDSALTDKLGREEKEKVLLDLNVADIACGSGAFLCAAMEKLGERLALIRKGDEERPTDEQLRESKRDVLLNCIYGVDLNPMAVELAKFSLWITASLPDMPLSFLDHKIKCGNSLIGATPELVRKGIPEGAYNAVTLDDPAICAELRKKVRKEFQQIAKAEEPTAQYGLKFLRNEKDELLHLRENLIKKQQDDTDEVDQVEEEYRKLEKMERKFKDWILADIWTSAFFIRKNNHDLSKYPTNATLEAIRENQVVDQGMINEAIKLSHQHRFFHFHLEFPEVFEKGGFDCVLGNPPWEQVQLEEEEWFKGKDDNISVTKNASKRTEKIKELEMNSPGLYGSFKLSLDFSNKVANYIKLSGAYSFSIFGWLNTYLIFTEKIGQLLSEKGYCGIIIPSGIVSDKNSMPLFHNLLKKGKIFEAIDYINLKGIFPTIDSRTKFCAFTFTGFENHFSEAKMSFNNTEINQEMIDEKVILVSYNSLFKISPNTKNCLTISSNNEFQLIYKIYSNSGILCVEDTEKEYITKQMFNISDKADQFITLNDTNKTCIKQNLLYENNEVKYYGLYESKFIHQFDHRFSTFEHSSKEEILSGNSSYVNEDSKEDRNKSIFCRYYISKEITERFYLKHEYPYSAIIAARMISRPSDERTLITSFVPRLAISNSVNLVLGTNKENLIMLLANLNTFICDFVCRKRIGGINLNLWNFNQLPIINTNSINGNLKSKVLSNVIKLSNTSSDLQEFFNDFTSIERVKWNRNLRFQLQCELDAIFAHLYGLEKSEMDYILETFPIVKRKDIEKYGSYRTKETILRLYDEFA